MSMVIPGYTAFMGMMTKVDAFIEGIETYVLDIIFQCICSCFPKSMASKQWFRITLPYLLTIFYMDMNNFGLAPALIPIALMNSTGNMISQENMLQLAMQISAPMLYVGDFFTFYVDVPIRYPLFGYLLLTLSIYIFGSIKETMSAINEESRYSISIYLVTAFCITQALSGYILIMAWRKASMEPPAEHREESSRLCGYADQISSFFGSVIALPLVMTSGSNCSI